MIGEQRWGLVRRWLISVADRLPFRKAAAVTAAVAVLAIAGAFTADRDSAAVTSPLRCSESRSAPT